MSDYEQEQSFTDDYSDPRQRQRRSRYNRPRSYVSWWGIVLGLVLGIGGGLYFAWNIAPIEEFDTAPRQLSADDRAQYLVAVMLSYSYTGNLDQTIQRLLALNVPARDPIQYVADVACNLASGGYVNSGSGLRAIRSLMTFYQQQGKLGCADSLIRADDSQTGVVLQITASVPTPLPAATKTPTPPGPAQPTPTPGIITAPTTPPVSAFIVLRVDTFCSTEISGVIEVRVLNFNGQPLPGQPVRVRWDGGQSNFFTGLKPERGPEYADFQMEDGREYIIEMPRRSDPYPTPLRASPCTTEAGQTATTSYRVVFRQN